MEAFKESGLRLPRPGDQDDVMMAPFMVLATVLPQPMLSPSILARNTSTQRIKFALRTAIFTHPGWGNVRLLLEVLASNEAMTKFKKDQSDDYMHWITFLFDIIGIAIRRMLVDVRESMIEHDAEFDASYFPSELVETDKERNRASMTSFAGAY